MLSKQNVIKGHGIHWESIYNKLINKRELSNNDLIEFSKYYCFDYKEPITILNKPMNLNFCKNLEIKYEYEYNYLKNIMDNCIFYSHELNRFKNTLIKKDQNIEYLNNEIKNKNKIIENNEKKIKELENKLKELKKK